VFPNKLLFRRIGPNANAKCTLVSMDKKVFHSNNLQARYWDDGEGNYPPPKSQGTTVTTAYFVSQSDGFLAFSDAVWDEERDKG